MKIINQYKFQGKIFLKNNLYMCEIIISQWQNSSWINFYNNFMNKLYNIKIENSIIKIFQYVDWKNKISYRYKIIQ